MKITFVCPSKNTDGKKKQKCNCKAFYITRKCKNIEDNKKFRKTIEFSFSGKSSSFENISLTKNSKLVANYFEIAETLAIYFQNLVPDLYLKVPNNLLCQTVRNVDKF